MTRLLHCYVFKVHPCCSVCQFPSSLRPSDTPVCTHTPSFVHPTVPTVDAGSCPCSECRESGCCEYGVQTPARSPASSSFGLPGLAAVLCLTLTGPSSRASHTPRHLALLIDTHFPFFSQPPLVGVGLGWGRSGVSLWFRRAWPSRLRSHSAQC